MTFQKQCGEAAAKFLQTAVLVDDQAEFNATIGAAVEDNAVDHDFVEPDALAGVSNVEVPVALPRPAREKLDAGAITRGFADRGLICSVLKPLSASSIEAEVVKLAPKSDIIVLDWQMGDGDNGDTALSIIHGVLRSDSRSGGRLRLIVIYTGVRDLRTIAQQIANDLPYLRVGSHTFEFQDDEGTAKIVVLGKGVAADHVADQGTQCVEETGLASRVIAEFSKFSGGILRNATLASIGHLRNNTHRLLARLNPSLDGPLITHYALVNSTPDAQQYVADLILQEIEAQVPLAEIVATFTSPSSIKARFAELYKEGAKAKIVLDEKSKVTHELTDAEAVSLIDGVSQAIAPHHKDFAKALGKKPEQMPGLFTGDALAGKLYCVLGEEFDEGVKRHEEFAIASGIRLSNGKSHDFRHRSLPSVTLGTVINDGEFYYVCLTPVCDSVRKTGESANFLFARLIEGADKFNLVVDDLDKRVRLFMNRKDAFIKTFELRPHSDQTVRVEKKYIDYVVQLAGPPDSYVRWVAELKPMQAQRLVGSLTSNLSRIGLDEFEWLRVLAENWSG